MDDALLGVEGVCYGAHEDAVAVHVLVAHVPDVLVVLEVHDEGAHEGVVVLAHLP